MQRSGIKFALVGYEKILDTSQLVNKMRYERMWVNTCCIDKWNYACYPRPSIPYTAGIKTRGYGKRISTMSMVLPPRSMKLSQTERLARVILAREDSTRDDGRGYSGVSMLAYLSLD